MNNLKTLVTKDEKNGTSITVDQNYKGEKGMYGTSLVKYVFQTRHETPNTHSQHEFQQWSSLFPSTY